MARNEGAVAEASANIDTENVDAEVEAATEPKLSPKAKASLGLAEDVVITWVPVANDEARNTLFRKVARARSTDGKKVKVVDVYNQIFATALTGEVLAALEAEAATVPETVAKSPSTKALPEDPDEAIKVLEAREKAQETRMQKAQAAANKAREMLAAARARAQGGTAPAVTEDTDGATA